MCSRLVLRLARIAFFLCVLVGVPTLGWAQGPGGGAAAPAQPRAAVAARAPAAATGAKARVAAPAASVPLKAAAVGKADAALPKKISTKAAAGAPLGPPAIREPLRGADPLAFPVGKFEMALGVSSPPKPGQASYYDFAKKLGVHYFAELFNFANNPLARFKLNLDTAIGSAKRVHFNLDGFDMERFEEYVADPVASDLKKEPGYGIITNYELKSILTDPGLLSKTTFYGKGGKVVDAPKLPEPKAKK